MVTSWLWPALMLSVVAETENSPAFSPDRVMLVISSGIFPVLATVRTYVLEDSTCAGPNARKSDTEIPAVRISGSAPIPFKEILVVLVDELW